MPLEEDHVSKYDDYLNDADPPHEEFMGAPEQEAVMFHEMMMLYVKVGFTREEAFAMMFKIHECKIEAYDWDGSEE